MKKKYMVTVVNSAGDYIEHKRFRLKASAVKYALTRGSHCVVEIWRLV